MIGENTMDKSKIIDYYKSVCEAYRLGNVESQLKKTGGKLNELV